MARQSPRGRLFPYPVAQRYGPFRGVNQQRDPDAFDARDALDALNMRPVSGEGGRALVSRPSFERLTSGTLGTIQGVALFRDTSTIIFAAGVMWRLDWTASGDKWVPSLVNVTPAGITIDASSRVEAVMFIDRLVVTDGVNRPWSWDGAAGTYLTDIPAGTTVRSPTVYYGKMFFIKTGGASPPLPGVPNRSIIWSEEADELIGYENATYNNYWNLTLTDDEELKAIRATNNALYYWRPSAIGSVQGAITTDFTTEGTHDGISRDVGTLYPWHVTEAGGYFYFYDDSMRPWRVGQNGNKPEALWQQAREVRPYNVQPGSAPDRAESWVSRVPGYELVMFGGYLGTREALMFDEASGRYAGMWQLPGVVSSWPVGGIARGGDGREELIASPFNGIPYRLKAPALSPGTEPRGGTGDYTTFASASWTAAPELTAFPRRVLTQFAGGNDLAEKYWEQARIRVRRQTLEQSIDYATRTTRGPLSSSRTFTVDASADVGIDVLRAIALEVFGRIVQLELSQTTTTVPLELIDVTISGDAIALEPETP